MSETKIEANNHLGQAIDNASNEIQLDANAKEVLADKSILAEIVHELIPGFENIPLSSIPDPIHPRSLYPDRYKYTNTAFYCQYGKNTLTVFGVNVTARPAFTTWRAVHCRPYILLSKQCIPV